MIDNATHIHFADLLNLDYDSLDWQFFREGISIFPLYQSATSAASSALLKYVAGGEAPLHEHLGYEHIFVLQGSQEDLHDEYFKGSFVINKPGTQHGVKSKNGCVVLAIWEQPVKFL